MFNVGQKVVCINGNFPVIKELGGDVTATPNTPHVGEVLKIDDVLGDFLRFFIYDTESSYNWWLSSHFAPIQQAENMIGSEVEMYELANDCEI